MSCSACSAHVENAVNKLESVSGTVNLLSNTLVAEFDERKITENDIISAVKSAGYGAKIHSENKINDKRQIDFKLFKLILSVLLLILVKQVYARFSITFY